ncbi:MAG TPA: PEP/pyruvate-binding domain-containing protein [Alphaproteobacteria bacterium]|nr:PEP/pyruvate-binding domain-containing protein [Alphaproteobacteria bacterium]
MNGLVIPVSDGAALDAERVGPKAANLAAMAHAGMPTPGGFCISADAYRLQLREMDLERAALRYGAADDNERRRISVDIRLGLYQGTIAPAILEPALESWRAQRAESGEPGAVRSSALIEDRAGAKFAGQFESFLGLTSETDFTTALRACWAALWTTNVRRYMDGNDLTPGDTAMSVLVQPLVPALASGGGLSRTAEGEMLISATWGLGTAIAQGEVVPDRVILGRDLALREVEAGRKDHSDQCHHHGTPKPRKVAEALAGKPCLDGAQSRELGRHLLAAEAMMGHPVEIEWAMDAHGIKLLQVRPLDVGEMPVPDEIWQDKPGLRGHPAGVGWGAGRAVVIECECQLGQVAPGDVLVTRVAGPALSHILPRVAGVVAELGGSTSHLASLARERGIPMVLGALNATGRIPDGSLVAVDGIAGVVRWMDYDAGRGRPAPGPRLYPPDIG